MFGYPDDGSTTKCEGREAVVPTRKSTQDLEVQLGLSLVLGVSAFIAFCLLRPRWPALYAARQRHLDPKIKLPKLSDSFFGWIPQLYRVTEEQVLGAAGLDAFVFLAFFKMAIRLFSIMSFFALVVLVPINNRYRKDPPPEVNGVGNNTAGDYGLALPFLFDDPSAMAAGGDHEDKSRQKTFLWTYVIFTYFFVGLTLYFLNGETFRIIGIRQEYLGTQSTVTDRTFRLTGIPTKLRSEARLRILIEKLKVGRVDTITVCRNWGELDKLVKTRDQYLRRLETAWAGLLKQRESDTKDRPANDTDGATASENTPSGDQDGDEESGENGHLLRPDTERQYDVEADRPKVVLRYGFLGLRRRSVDAIDYYEEKLRRIDDEIIEMRKNDFAATDMALVTMDSVAACQMVIQARIDPRPGRLLAKATPSPSDLVWKNTYASRGVRRLKSWGITLLITGLTLLWILPTAGLAGLISICTLRNIATSFVDWLEGHTIVYSLFLNGLPTLAISLFNIAVPYLYDFLSNHQGMISQGDVELSLISKNYFFTFFNTFFIFAVSKVGLDFLVVLQQLLKDTSLIPGVIAKEVERLVTIYTAFIMLQGIGLMPFRILEAGSACLYPIYRMLSKTPRDFAELRKPPAFQYGFYLPTALLIFNICIIYSVLMSGLGILIFGTIYFVLGYFAFKYMLVYAMDQPQHATGGAWRIICYRIVIGLLVFEVVMVGQIASQAARIQSFAILPLVPFTIWYSYYFGRRFEPLTKYIALRAIGNSYDPDNNEAIVDPQEDEEDGIIGSGFISPRTMLRRGSTLDELKEKGLTFVNPSLVTPLQQPWIYADPPPPIDGEGSSVQDDDSLLEQHHPLILPNADSSLGIGDDNVWSSGR